MDRGYIDIASRFGPAHGPGRGGPLSALIAEQRAHGVHLSLAHSRVAVQYATTTGNSGALEAAADPANRLAPVAVVDASTSRDAGTAIERCARAGAVGFWFESREVSVGLEAETATSRLRAVAATGRPAFFPLGSSVLHPAAASAIGRATAHLGIPVVLVGVHYSNATEVLEAAQRYPNLHVETSGLVHWAAVETAVDRIGHERVLFGSGGPARAMQGPLNAILLAELPAEAKRAILAGNAARLLRIPVPEVDLAAPLLPQDAYDVHTHYMPASAYDVPVVRNEELLQRLSRWGTTGTASSSFNAFAADLVEGNRETVTASASGAGQGGLLVLDPADYEASAEAMTRWRNAPGIRGGKIHSFYSGVHTADRRMEAIFRLAAAHDLPVKIHNDGPDWHTAIGAYAKAWPRLRILLAHAGPGSPSVEAGNLAATYDNVFLELASSFANLPTMRELVRIAGPEKIAWGTDAPLLDPRFVLGSYMDAGLGPDVTPGVYRDTAIRIFGPAR